MLRSLKPSDLPQNSNKTNNWKKKSLQLNPAGVTCVRIPFVPNLVMNFSCKYFGFSINTTHETKNELIDIVFLWQTDLHNVTRGRRQESPLT